MLESKFQQLLDSQKHERIGGGCSGDAVYFLSEMPAYLKIGNLAENSDLLWERRALDWLAGKFPVPAVIDFDRNEHTEFILISNIRGNPASEIELSIETAPDFILKAATALKRFHEIPIGYCPLDQRLDAKLAKARENFQGGYVDEGDFDNGRIGQSAEQLYRELCRTPPADEDLVFTHGDFCLPNIIVNNGEIAGLIDLDRAGVADRYQDVALFLRSFESNCAAKIDYQKIFCEAYGIDEIAPDKIDYYMKLDELF
ncbi:MAG: APH(3') family aminoglycoside O-phosphotransferase [Pyrinomonadaceae bacterium]